MRDWATHAFQQAPELWVELQASRLIAFVDLDSYPPLAGAKPDYLDLLQHLCAQREALTATFWEVPPEPLCLQVMWAPDEGLTNSYVRCGPPLATGVVRTGGRLGLASDAQLLTLSREEGRTVAQGGGNYRELLVAPGIYAVSVFNLATPPVAKLQAPASYSVILTHHAHPPPRLQPIRFNSHLLFGNGAADQENSRDSHKMPR